MNCSSVVSMIAITALIMLFVNPVQSIPTRHKRWTFNSWRLHGRRDIQPSYNPTTEAYLPTVTNDVIDQDQLFNVDNDDDDDTMKMLLRLLQFFQLLEHEQKQKDNINNQR